jgi:hypothetical protein
VGGAGAIRAILASGCRARGRGGQRFGGGRRADVEEELHGDGVDPAAVEDALLAVDADLAEAAAAVEPGPPSFQGKAASTSLW